MTNRTVLFAIASVTVCLLTFLAHADPMNAGGSTPSRGGPLVNRQIDNINCLVEDADPDLRDKHRQRSIDACTRIIDGYAPRARDGRLPFDDVEDMSNALNARCWARATWGQELELALADCNEALRLLPPAFVGRYLILDSRGFVYLRMGKFAEAIADYDASLATGRRIASSLYGRGIARLRSGATDAGNVDLKAGLSLSARIGKRFAEYGIVP